MVHSRNMFILTEKRIAFDNVNINKLQKDTNLRMKCQMSRRMCICGQAANMVRTWLEQQSLSTYNTSGGSSCAVVYRWTIPSTILFRPFLPSLAVSTLMSTWPCSLPTFVHHSAVSFASPCNFLRICKYNYGCMNG